VQGSGSISPHIFAPGTRHGTWNIMGFYGAGSLKTVVSELAKYNLDLVVIQEVR
jgi:hypothetical protein